MWPGAVPHGERQVERHGEKSSRTGRRTDGQTDGQTGNVFAGAGGVSGAGAGNLPG